MIALTRIQTVAKAALASAARMVGTARSDTITTAPDETRISIGYAALNWDPQWAEGQPVSIFTFYRMADGRRICEMEGEKPRATPYYFQYVIPWLKQVIHDTDLPLTHRTTPKAPVLRLVAAR